MARSSSPSNFKAATDCEELALSCHDANVRDRSPAEDGQDGTDIVNAFAGQGITVDQRKTNAIIEKSTFTGANIEPKIENQQNASYSNCKIIHNHYHEPSEKPDFTEEGMTWLLRGKFSMFNRQPLHNIAKVYLGRQYFLKADSSKDVAVKLVEYRTGRDREVKVLQKLHHPNIVQVIDFGEYDGLGHWIYIIMELCSQSLYDNVISLCKNSLNYPQCISFSKQILEAVVYLHKMKIIHRDLKPANILISRCGNFVKVSDFGISKELEEGQEEATNTAAGTEGYMAPELLKDKSKVSFASDVFSYGIVTCFIFSQGAHPYGSNPHVRSANIINNKPPDLSILSQCPAHNRTDLVDLVKLTIRPNPRKRPSSQELLNHSIFFPVRQDDHIMSPTATHSDNHGEKKRSVLNNRRKENVSEHRIDKAKSNFFATEMSSDCKVSFILHPSASAYNKDETTTLETNDATFYAKQLMKRAIDKADREWEENS